MLSPSRHLPAQTATDFPTHRARSDFFTPVVWPCPLSAPHRRAPSPPPPAPNASPAHPPVLLATPDSGRLSPRSPPPPWCRMQLPCPGLWHPPPLFASTPVPGGRPGPLSSHCVTAQVTPAQSPAVSRQGQNQGPCHSHPPPRCTTSFRGLPEHPERGCPPRVYLNKTSSKVESSVCVRCPVPAAPGPLLPWDPSHHLADASLRAHGPRSAESPSPTAGP